MTRPLHLDPKSPTDRPATDRPVSTRPTSPALDRPSSTRPAVVLPDEADDRPAVSRPPAFATRPDAPRSTDPTVSRPGLAIDKSPGRLNSPDWLTSDDARYDDGVRSALDRRVGRPSFANDRIASSGERGLGGWSSYDDRGRGRGYGDWRGYDRHDDAYDRRDRRRDRYDHHHDHDYDDHHHHHHHYDHRHRYRHYPAYAYVHPYAYPFAYAYPASALSLSWFGENFSLSLGFGPSYYYGAWPVHAYSYTSLCAPYAYRRSSYTYSYTYSYDYAYAAPYAEIVEYEYDYYPRPAYTSYTTTYRRPSYTSTTTYVSSDPYAFSYTDYVSSRRVYAYTRDYAAPAASYTTTYVSSPSSFRFFSDLGPYESRRVPDYVRETQVRRETRAASLPESEDPVTAGYARFAEGNYYQAIVEFDRAIAESPDDGLLRFARAQAQFAIRNYRSAHEDIVRGMDLIPDWGRVEINMYEFYRDPAVLDAQIRALEDWTATYDADPDAHLVLGYVRYFLQDYERAKTEIIRTLALRPDHAQAKRLLDNVYERETAARLAEAGR